MKIIVSGITGSGKSTLAKILAKKLNLEYIGASKYLKDSLPKRDFEHWESKKGLEAIKFRLKHLQYDKKLDDFLLKKIASKKDFVLDSWVASWKFFKKGTIKICLKSDFHTRAKRVAERDNTSLKKAADFTRKKDFLTEEIYKKLYKVDIEKDLGVFDLVIDDTHLQIKPTLDIVMTFLKNQK